ncbi:MAG: gephyrin-like molybdotransferase Glp [Bacteroidia bacterium]
MLTVEEAKNLLFNQVSKSEPVEIDISYSLGCVLSVDIISPINQPEFDNSSMDGYAVASIDDLEQRKFEVIGEIKAGDPNNFNLKSGQAVRIFTGAIVPDTADSIVIQEKVEAKDGFIYLKESYKKGAFIRTSGSMMKKGDLALEAGFVFNPAAIGFLASMGIFKVKVYKNPEVSIITTGDEIMKPGTDLKPGQIYESNSFSLAASLKQMGIEPTHILTATDQKEDLKNQIKIGLNSSDILILTGGISVGKYDLVYEILKEFGVETIFYKVAQKPGKPFFAGRLNDKFIFALPGNPAAVLVCFYEYVYPVIRTMQGFTKTQLQVLNLKLLKTIKSNEDRAQFIRAKVTEEGVMPLEGQDSFMLYSFAMANALIYVPNGTEIINENEMVEVHLLP